MRLTLFTLLGLVLVSCSQPLTVDQQIIATIEQMEEKIESGERRAFMQYIADDFSAQDGQMNRDQVRALVVFQLNRHKQLEARLLPIKVDETGIGQARAVFRALITGGPGWIPDSGQVYEFTTQWRQDGDDWLLLSANWDPVPLDEVIPDVLKEN